jgi:hypothetical protein
MRFLKLPPKIVATLFIALLTGVLVATLTSAYKRTDTITNTIASHMLGSLGKLIIQRTNNLLQTTTMQLQTNATLTQYTGNATLPDTQAYWLPLFWQQLTLNPHLSAMYVADTQGNFLSADRLPLRDTRVIDARNGAPVEKRTYRQADYSVLANTETASQYDPRVRPWYTTARDGKAGTIYWSKVYRFATSGIVGVTASTPFFDAQGKLAGVLAADITLQGLSDFLTAQAFGDHDVALILNPAQELVAYPTRVVLGETALTATQQDKLPTLAELKPEQGWIQEAYRKVQQQNQETLDFKYDGEHYLVVAMDVPNLSNGWKLLVVAPEDDLLGGASRSIAENLTISLFALLLFGFILYVTFGRTFANKDNSA